MPSATAFCPDACFSVGKFFDVAARHFDSIGLGSDILPSSILPQKRFRQQRLVAVTALVLAAVEPSVAAFCLRGDFWFWQRFCPGDIVAGRSISLLWSRQQHLLQKRQFLGSHSLSWCQFWHQQNDLVTELASATASCLGGNRFVPTISSAAATCPSVDHVFVATSCLGRSRDGAGLGGNVSTS